MKRIKRADRKYAAVFGDIFVCAIARNGPRAVPFLQCCVPAGHRWGAMGVPPVADKKKGSPQSLLCGERKSQGTVGIFRLRKMELCSLCFDEASGSGRQMPRSSVDAGRCRAPQQDAGPCIIILHFAFSLFLGPFCTLC
jgi:hypothetical protein